MRGLRYVVSFLLGTVLISGCGRSDTEKSVAAPAMVISISSDGRYAVSSHRDNRVVLWDLEDRSQRLITDSGNIYSAYIVRGGDLFLWQGLDDVVRVERFDGARLKSFPHFATYGHVMSADLQHYFASDSKQGIWPGDLARGSGHPPSTPTFHLICSSPVHMFA